MEIKTHHLEVKKTARYASAGNLSESTKYFWFVLHGSLMTCEQILYKFSDFDPESHFIVAPEALSRTYLQGLTGEPVATWMTKRDRLFEIEDFSSYLTKLYNDCLSKLPVDCTKIVMGFSQGGTTALRWLHNSQIDLDISLSYSCWIPEDIDLKESETDLSKVEKIYTYGEQDQYLTADKIELTSKIIDRNNFNPSFEPYPGNHRIDKQQLLFLFNTYIK